MREVIFILLFIAVAVFGALYVREPDVSIDSHSGKVTVKP